MNSIKVLFTMILLTFVGADLSAQSKAGSGNEGVKTEMFKVWGNCDMCKTRIETAVKSAGATSANWDKQTKMLTVSFDPQKTSVDAMSKKLASVGHDTKKYKAPDAVYDKLPSCCHYYRSNQAE